LSRAGRFAAVPVAWLALTAGAASAGADDSADYLRRHDWSFNISPYVWAASLKGTAAAVPGLPSIKVDASFKDILQNLDLAAMTLVELRYRRFAAYADIVYTDISTDADLSSRILFDDIDAESELFIGTFGGAYRAVEGDRGFLDLLAGARVWSVDTRLDVNGGLLDGQEIEDNENWVDPVIGLKGRFDFGHGFFLYGLGQVGGFGVGSDLTWDAFGGFGYQFNDTISAIAGYRHLEVDYEHEAFKFDVELSGPVIGVTIHF
jgi:hypothetical protein